MKNVWGGFYELIVKELILSYFPVGTAINIDFEADLQQTGVIAVSLELNKILSLQKNWAPKVGVTH